MKRLFPLLALCGVLLMGCTQEPVKAPINGELWLDTDGNHINAHGGNIIKYEGRYYWYGENRPEQGGTTDAGISAYSSTDLKTWQNEGVVLSVSEEEGSDIERGCIMERPKVVYNEKTGTFVMLFHLELKGRGYEAARVAFAVSDSPIGPFEFIRSQRMHANLWPINMTEEEIALAKSYKPEEWNDNWWSPEWMKATRDGVYLWRDIEVGQMSRDQTVYVEDGKAYHITSSQENSTLVISELTDDFLEYTGKYARMIPGGHNEAPVIFKHDGRYWLICSGCTGWAPNDARLFTSTDLWGPWTQIGNPCVDENGRGCLDLGAEKTFGAQGTYCLQLESGEYIFMADIWKPDNLRNSLHLWLPIRYKEDGTPYIQWEDSWEK